MKTVRNLAAALLACLALNAQATIVVKEDGSRAVHADVYATFATDEIVGEVPEPAGIAIFALGAGLMAWVHRRRKTA